MDQQDTAIELTQFTRRYAKGCQIGPLTLSFQAGQCHGLVGANGAGKTTILRSLVGLDGPSGGTVRVNGQTPSAGNPAIGVAGMIEEPSFFGWLSGAQNLHFAFPDRSISGIEIERALREVGLTESGSRRVRAYSQGMRQRLGIARVLLADPAVVILDEPTNGLDPVGILWLRGLVARLVSEGRTVLFSSHLLHEVQSTCQTYAMISAGKVVAQGAVKEIDQHASLEDLYLSVARCVDK